MCIKPFFKPTPWAILLAVLCSMQMEAQTCKLNCTGKVNISLDEDCQRVIGYDDVLDNPVCTTLTLSLSYPFGTNILSNGAVDRSHLGYTFIYRVKDDTNNNSCWGYVTIEDKFPPQPLCKNNLRISCFQLAQFMEQVNIPQDNCGQAGKAVITALNWKDYGCDSTILGRVFRSITTYDDWGNSSSCNDTLLIKKDRLPYIKCADNISLNCRILCRKPEATGSITDRTNYDLIVFSSEKTNKNYPSPELLLKLQMADTFNSTIRKCLPKDTLLVPAINDTILLPVSRNSPYPAKSGLPGIASKDTCVYIDSCVTLWTSNGPRKGGLCKVTLEYTDQITFTCGNSFKIRRQWRISDWCLGRDTVCIQYIKIEDHEKPVVIDGKKYYSELVKPHECISNVSVEKLVVDDCDEQVKQDFTISYVDGHLQKTILQQGQLPGIVNLPATDAIYGRRCFTMYVDLADRCFNRTRDSIEICVTDNTPPTPLCDGESQVVVDPSTCWARVYAADLDNGSRDNCCNVLHFAIARMTDVEKFRSETISRIERTCGKKEYWDKKVFYDAYIENYINCYIFRDYIDLTECGEQRVILRIYEACGVPRYDAHTFPCSEHDWYCYNTSHLYRAELNFNWLDKRDKWYTGTKQKDCTWRPRVLCGDSLSSWIMYLNSKLYDDREVFPGSINLPVFKDFNQIFEFHKDCFDLSFANGFLSRAQTVSAYPTGNTCSKYLYNECMVRVQVIDKTFPVCEKPKDIYIYCDGVVGGKEYTSAQNFNCTNGIENSKWPKEIECKKENDGDLSDAFDRSGKYYGYYGGPLLIPTHEDHSGYAETTCFDNQMEYEKVAWQPIYCKEWLCLDSLDKGGKVNYRSYFAQAKAYSGGKPTSYAGENMFWIYDNCKMNDTITFTDEESLDKCGRGWIKRTWKAKDQCGNTITCDQKIYAQSRSDFEVIFPADVIVNCRDINTVKKLEPATGAITGNVMVMDDECELVGVHYEDVRYDAVDGECYKIVRTWTLTDWCQYDPNQHDRYGDVIVNDTLVANKESRACIYRHLKDNGDGYIKYIQIIKVVDDERPKLACKDTTICTYVEGCKERFTFKFKATDNCTPDSLITYRYELDEKADGSINVRSIPSVKSFNEILASGDHLLTVYASDGCGNEDTCTIKLTVKDCKKPTPYCLNGIATVLMPTSGSLILWATDFNAGSFDNCTSKENLKYYFGKKSNQDTIGFTSDTFTCSRLGQQDINIWVVDEAGNADKCLTYVLMQDNNTPKICGTSPLAAIQGKILTETNEPVQDVKVSLAERGIVHTSKITAADGKYSFESLPLNKSYAIIPYQNEDYMNGVSTLDLMLIQQHILGIKPLNSMYKMVAADVNNNASIDVVDLLELRKLILGIYTELPSNKSWRFAEKATADASRPFNFTETIQKPGEQLSASINDFVGIKIGDVNQSVKAHSLLGAESRASKANLNLYIEDQSITKGNRVQIEIKSNDITTLNGLQFTFNIDLSSLEYTGYLSDALNISELNLGMSHLSKGIISFSWNSDKTVNLKKDESLFKLTFSAKSSGELSKMITINSRVTKAEAYSTLAEADVKNIHLTYNNSKTSNIKLYQNTPNPFSDNTVIPFELPAESTVQMDIMDITGRVVKTIKGNFSKGYNQILVQKHELKHTGVYYCQLKSGGQIASIKMLLMN